MRLVLGEDAAVAAYVSAGLRTPIIPPFTSFGIVNAEGFLCGGVIFNDYNGSNIEASVYGTACAKRGILRAVMNYVFIQNRCLRLTCRTKRSNKTVARQLTRLGFKYEGTLKKFFGPDRGDDAIVYALFPKDALRWLGAKP